MMARASFLSRGIAIGTIAACAAIAGWGGNPGADSIEGRSLLAVAITSAYLAFCAAVALRHQRRRHAQERMWMSGEDSAAADASAPAKGEAILIAFASQTGFAEQLAMQTAQSLRAGQNGKSSVRVLPLGRIDESQLASFARALFKSARPEKAMRLTAPPVSPGAWPASMPRLHFQD